MPSRGAQLWAKYVCLGGDNKPLAGDLANHTINWTRDNTRAEAANNQGGIGKHVELGNGLYNILITSAEADCGCGGIDGMSSTSGAVIVPVSYTFEIGGLSVPSVLADGFEMNHAGFVYGYQYFAGSPGKLFNYPGMGWCLAGNVDIMVDAGTYYQSDTGELFGHYTGYGDLEGLDRTVVGHTVAVLSPTDGWGGRQLPVTYADGDESYIRAVSTRSDRLVLATENQLYDAVDRLAEIGKLPLGPLWLTVTGGTPSMSGTYYARNFAADTYANVQSAIYHKTEATDPDQYYVIQEFYTGPSESEWRAWKSDSTAYWRSATLVGTYTPAGAGASGNVTVAPGYGWRTVEQVGVDARATATTVAGLLTGETAVKLSATGLDNILTTAPAGVASNFREMLVAVWRHIYKKVVKDKHAKTISHYADDGTTKLTTQAYTSNHTADTINAAT